MNDTQKTGKPPMSKYAQKRRSPLEATHDRHRPPVAGCPKCDAEREASQHA